MYIKYRNILLLRKLFLYQKFFSFFIITFPILHLFLFLGGRGEGLLTIINVVSSVIVKFSSYEIVNYFSLSWSTVITFPFFTTGNWFWVTIKKVLEIIFFWRLRWETMESLIFKMRFTKGRLYLVSGIRILIYSN